MLYARKGYGDFKFHITEFKYLFWRLIYYSSGGVKIIHVAAAGINTGHVVSISYR
jgi:hypothetical protein